MSSERIQITIIRIDDYGPWTQTLGDDREHRLQILQSQLYAHLVDWFASQNGVLFYNKYDEMIAVSNGIPLSKHKEIQRSVAQRFPVNISMSVGVGETPYEAQLKASELFNEVVRRVAEPRSLLIGEALSPINKGLVKIVHFDVDDFTHRWTNTQSVYESARIVRRLYYELTELMFENHSLLFYNGGDNYVSVSNGMPLTRVEQLISNVDKRMGIPLKAGIGISRTGRKAMQLATSSLEYIREGKTHSKVHVLEEL